MSLVDRDASIDNILDQFDDLKERISILESYPADPADYTLSDVAYVYLLAQDVGAAETVITLNKEISGGSDELLFLVIDPFTTDCEIRKVTSVLNEAYTIAALTYAHDEDRLVYAIYNPIVNVKWFGATGDGVTDDLIAINRATTAAQATTGAAMIVEMPPGIYLVSDTIDVPNKVILRGVGPIARTGAPGSTIKAKTGFSGSYVIQLGDDASNSIYSRLENIGVDGDHICDIGVYSNSINEEAGILRCTIVDCDTYGIHMDNSSSGLCRNYFLRDIYILNDTGGGSAIGVFIHGGSSPQRGIDGLTVDGSNLNVGLRIDGVQGAVFERIHLENAIDGIKIGPNVACHACTFIGITGHSTLTDLIHIASASASNQLQFIGLFGNSATNVLNDAINGIVFTGNYIAQYMLGDMDSTGGNKQTLDLWYLDNVAASLSAAALTRMGGDSAQLPNAWIAPKAGSVIGIAIRSNAARTAGTLTVEVYKNGSIALGLTAILDGTNTTFHSSFQKMSLDQFAAGDYLSVKVTTDGTWAPTTADIRSMIEVEM